jgi:hypothetical protein
MGVEQPTGEGRPVPAGTDAAARLQILATEHWSLLATRSLTYSESFSRVSMFFSVLSGAVISLALVAQAGRLGGTFLAAAILVLSVVLFVGVATVLRMMAVNLDDIRWVIGMNPLRHAYLDLHPELEEYFVTGWNDDLRGISLTLGLEDLPQAGPIRNLGHGFQTLPGMLSVVVAVVVGALGALIAVALGGLQVVAVITGAIAFLLSLAVMMFLGARSFMGFAKRITPRFPTS